MTDGGIVLIEANFVALSSDEAACFASALKKKARAARLPDCSLIVKVDLLDYQPFNFYL